MYIPKQQHMFMINKKPMIKYILIIASLILVGQSTSAQIAVKGETIYTVSGKTIKDGVVLIENGKITKVGTASKVKIPNNFKVYEGKVVTPGLVDAHTTVGFSGIYNKKDDQMQLEKTAPIQPELRAIDGYNPHVSNDY